ncbi:MAG: site-2 protease family protein [Candidatus Thermoplasmatota archaeon]|nr:site-2 protease family protein [Candidatus Thermoplasmatota archaeon]
MLGRNQSFRATYVARPPTKLRFSRIELQQIGISIFVLSLAFTIFFTDPLYRGIEPVGFAFSFGVSLAAVVTGFAFHEMAHKLLAQKYGCWAEFRMSSFGLLFALVTAFLGFIFAAPGAVHISGRITKEQSGKISVAGPLTNAAVGGAFLALTFAFAVFAPDWFGVPWTIAFINLILGAFNMIPFPPFDGSKVLSWNKGVYALAVAVVGALLGTTWYFSQILVILGL